MSFIFATRVAIPLDPMSHVPKSLCGWEPWDTHLRDPKGKGPPGEFQRQETLTAPQGTIITAEAGVVCSDHSVLFRSDKRPPPPPPMAISAVLPVTARASSCTAEWSSHTIMPAQSHHPILPRFNPSRGAIFQLLASLDHCYSTWTKRKNKLEKGKSVITLLTIAVISCHLCQFVPSFYFLLCVD